MRIVPLSDLTAPELRPYTTLRRSMESYKEGLFVAEGRLLVERLLQTKLALISVVCTPPRFEQFRALLEARTDDSIVYVAERAQVEACIGVNYHHGVMALARIPTEQDVETFLANQPREKPLLLLALDGLTQAENAGTITRAAAALGVDAIISGEMSCSPWLRRAVRNSMGGVFNVPIFHPPSLVETLKSLRAQHDVRVVGADPGGKQMLTQYKFDTRTCLVLGAEFEGITEPVRVQCDDLVSIPVVGGMDSLNVAGAATVFLYEAMRSRGK